MENREKLFKQYKSDCPQTIGETDTAFDNDNFIDWLCQQNKQLLDEIDMLKFQLKAADSVNENLSKQVEWISVEDRLPEFNKNVLVLDSTGRIDISFVDKTGTFDEFILEATHREDESVIFTHWMPLPNQPK